MNRRTLFTACATTLAAAVTSASAADDPEKEFHKAPVKDRARVWLKVVKPAFAVAYFLGEADERLDLRPSSVDDPFGKDAAGRPGDFLPGPRVLIGGVDMAGVKHHLDVANLIARVRQRARVPLDKLLTLMEGVVQPEVVSPIMECYDPHHVVICYNEHGEPCGGVEVCLSCNACRFDPGSDMLTKMCDTVKIARVLVEVGLPLDDKKTSIDDYAKQIAEDIREQEKSREEWRRKEQLNK
ncbi:MAG: hypothetical protein ACO1TE_28765 [Prosthecobacter sp.]